MTTSEIVSKLASDAAKAGASAEEARARALAQVPGWVRGTWKGLAFTEEHTFAEGATPVASVE